MDRLQTLSGHFLTSNSLATPHRHTFESTGNLKGKTIVITGASRGIGLAIAKKAAKDGANIAILAKSATEDPRIPGTIYSAAKEIEEAGGKALPIQCDIRDEAKVKEAVAKVVATFGGIDILVNNASAISLTDTSRTDMKKFDLMHTINTRGTYMVSKYCLPYLIESKNPHILNISPPLSMSPKWFAPYVAYTMAKYGMSMCVLGMSEEFKDRAVAVNALWPRTMIATAAIKNIVGGDSMMRKSRTDAIMADAAYVILTNKSTKLTGKFFVDEDVMRSVGVTDFSKYRVDPNIKEEELIEDGFLE